MSDSRTQSAGDNANQYESGRELNVTNNTVNYYGSEITRSDAEGICREVLQNSLPQITAEALNIFYERGEAFTLALIERTLARDPKLLGRMADPRIQVALSSAQKSYGETGDEDLGALLANVVSDMMSEPVRSHREQLLRQCVDIAPKLSQKQINALSVVNLLTRKFYPNIIEPDTLLNSMDSNLSVYYDKVPTKYLEYSYMESIGVGSKLQVTAESFGGKHSIYTAIHHLHPHSLCKEFAASDLPDDLDIADVAELLVRKTRPDLPDAFFPNPKLSDGLIAARKRAKPYDTTSTATDTRERLAEFIHSRSLTEAQLEDAAKRDYPRLAEFLELLNTTGASKFQLSAVGLMLAEQELAIRNPGGEAPMASYFKIVTSPDAASDSDATKDQA